MMKTKNVLLFLGIYVTVLLCSSCAPKVEIKNISTSFISEDKADYSADSSTVMSDVKKWYNKKNEGENISFSVVNEKNEKVTVAFPAPIVREESLSSDTDIPVNASVSIIPVRITHRGEVFFNGLEISTEAITGGIDVVRNFFARPVVIYLNSDKEAPFSTYLRVRNVLCEYSDQVSKEYFEKPFSELKDDEKEKIMDVFQVNPSEYIYNRHKVKAQWAKINID
ncbi:MAG: hypothetical protein PHD21_06325 [Flavobacteriales bacterium]|nr:hypothetical protein [Flavobacteriales bacterium]